MGYIVDLSEHNTVTDWPAAAKELEKVILRIGYRGSITHHEIREDAKFQKHLAAVKQMKIPYGIYFFPTSVTDEEAVEEAVWIRDHVKDLDLCMPVFLDTENVKSDRSGRADRLSKSTRTTLLRVISDRLLSYEIPCGVYSYTNWLANNVDLSQLDKRVIQNTWVAQNPKLTYTGTCAMWQYGTKKFSWTTAPVDVNRIMGRFIMEANRKEDKVAYSRDTIISKARTYLGAREGSSGHKQIIDRYNARKPLPRGYAVTYTDAWCATFVSSIAIQCGYTDIIPVECGCPQMITLAKSMGIWQESDANKPQKGDIILYDWQDSGAGDNAGNPDHIGYVESVSGSQMTIIEGNYNGAVKERTLAVNGRYIRGFITPRYTADAPAKKTASGKTELTITLPDIHLGDRGEHVRLWQFLADIEPQDGFYGPDSVADTKDWQKANGKTVDGWVGKGCWTKALKLKGWM